jgi:hypothetical protein
VVPLVRKLRNGTKLIYTDLLPGPDLATFTIGKLVAVIEAAGYECVGGPLHRGCEWIELKRRLGVSERPASSPPTDPA